MTKKEIILTRKVKTLLIFLLFLHHTLQLMNLYISEYFDEHFLNTIPSNPLFRGIPKTICTLGNGPFCMTHISKLAKTKKSKKYLKMIKKHRKKLDEYTQVIQQSMESEFKLDLVAAQTQNWNRIFDLSLNKNDPYFVKELSLSFDNDKFTPEKIINYLNDSYTFGLKGRKEYYRSFDDEDAKILLRNFFIPSERIHKLNFVKYTKPENAMDFFSGNFDPEVLEMLQVKKDVFGDSKNMETRIDVKYRKSKKAKSQIKFEEVDDEDDASAGIFSFESESNLNRKMEINFKHFLKDTGDAASIVKQLFKTVKKNSDKNKKSTI